MTHTTHFSRLTSLFLIATVLLLLIGCGQTRPATTDDEIPVGYGTQSPEDITGSVASVDPDESAPGRSSLKDLLQGQVAGVHVAEAPGGGIKVLIRGQSSIMGSSEPLYVIDGMPISTTSNGLLGINPADIKSIEVLKDAGSTAIYGSRGANGVVLVTTKRAGDQ